MAELLERPPFPCLSRYDTVNLAQGCALGCLYCASAGEPRARQGTLAALRRELDARPAKPELVYFSSDCEPFAGEARPALEAMALLLSRDIFLLIETRARVPAAFLELFSRKPELVKVQVGLPSLDDAALRVLEPGAPPAAARLATIADLAARSIGIEAGIGPLVPGLGDDDAAFERLCAALRAAGARKGSVSYLFLEAAARPRMKGLRVGAWSFDATVKKLYRKGREDCGGAAVWTARQSYRRERYESLRAIGLRHGLELKLCRCNNRFKSALPEESPVPTEGA